jgi:hypothetical protein
MRFHDLSDVFPFELRLMAAGTAAAASASAGSAAAFFFLFGMVVTVCSGIGKFAAEKRFYRLIRAAFCTSVQYYALIFQCLLRSCSDPSADNNIDIKGSTLADTVDFGILRCIVADPEEATRILKEHGFTASITELFAVALEDKPG